MGKGTRIIQIIHDNLGQEWPDFFFSRAKFEDTAGLEIGNSA